MIFSNNESGSRGFDSEGTKIRKLINKFHDRSLANLGPIGKIYAQSFQGGKHAKRLTSEEKEFLVYDHVLHPTWYPSVYKADKWAGVDSIVGTGNQGHQMNPGLKHDASGEIHKQIVGEDIILMDERKKEEQEVNTGTGGKVHLGRDKTGEHHIVVLGPTPSAIHESKIQYEQRYSRVIKRR